ncbi:hypothetical protein RDI58_018206 [Solanum bulbocastanum]
MQSAVTHILLNCP